MVYTAWYFLMFAGVCYAQEKVDLSWGFSEGTLFWPGNDRFHFTNQFAGSDENGVWYATNNFSLGEHCGTHIDAPYHFNKDGRTIEEIPVESLFTKGVLVNVTEETAGNSSFLMTSDKFKEWESENGPMPNNSVILISFGWSSRWPNKTSYFGPSDDNFLFPGVTTDAAQWIVDSRKVVGLGVDTPSPDISTDENFPVHKLLLGNDIYILENVALNENLPPLFDLYVFPMKIINGTGAPCRLIASTPVVDQ